jgi:hypothetical protein
MSGGGNFPAPILRPVAPSDTTFLYHVAANYPETWPRVCQKGVPVPHEFEALLWYQVLSQYMVDVFIAGQTVTIGLVSLYDADHVSGIVWVENVGLPGDHHEIVRCQALEQVIDRGFTSWPFRKIYGVHHSAAAPVFSGLGLDAPEEVRLREVYRHDGHLWDRVTCSVERSDWMQRSGTGS